ncbi:hypothetical protein ACYCS5_25180 [Paenibacillus sp. SEL3]
MPMPLVALYVSTWIMTEQSPLGRISGERLFIRKHEEVREVEEL